MSWTCSRGCYFTDMEAEMGMRMSTLDWLARQSQLEHDLNCDKDLEAKMARAHALGEGECPWPEYADAAIEIQEPEIIYV
jgi:hypothetical protein